MTDHIHTIPARIIQTRTPSEQLRQLIGADLGEGVEPFYWTAEISNNRLDFYFGRMAESTLRNFANDAAAGVTFLDSHRHYSLGYGQSLTGKFEASGDLNRTVAEFYTVPGIRFASSLLTYASTDDFIRAAQARLARDVSVGFYGGDEICDICGEDVWAINWDTWSYYCPHIPGVEYPIGEQGEETILATFTVEDARLAEVSAVYDGATPGATIEKAERMIEAGELAPQHARQLEVRYRIKLPQAKKSWQGADTGKRGAMPEPQTDERGQNLASTLNDLIDDMTDDETSRSDVIAEMAEAAGISSGTVNQILNEEIDCPPLERLEGFAEVLDTTADDLVAAAEEDGCSYSTETEGETMNELDQIRALLGETDAEGDSLIDKIRTLVGEIVRLQPLADMGRQYRSDLIDAALAEGVRAQGDKFPAETYRGMLENAGIDHIKSVRDSFAEQARQRLPGGRQTLDEDQTETTPRPAGRRVPDEAYTV